MSHQRTRWLLTGLFIGWIFFTLGSFYAVQKPFTASSPRLVSNALAQLMPLSAIDPAAIGNCLLDLLAAGWLALVALVTGTWLLQKLLPDRSLVETTILGAGLGLGLLGFISLALGFLGLFQPATAYGILIVLSGISLPQARRLFVCWRVWRPVNRPNWLTVFFLAAMAGLALSVALLPPTDWDGLFYHLTGPKLYLAAGRVTGGIDIPHLSFPALMEMLYAWAILLRGDIAAKLLHTVFALLLAGLVYLSGGRLLDRKAAWPAMLLLVSMPMIGTLAGWAYNDLALAFYQLASIYAIINYQLVMNNEGLVDTGNSLASSGRPGSDSDGRRWVVLSGLFAGLAMGLKYTSFVTPLVVGGLILWVNYRPARPTRHVSRLTGLADFAIFAAVALMMVLPWYAKNWVFTGNPVYPFLSGIFDGQYWDDFRATWYAAAGTGIGFRPGTLLALPWLLTLGVRDANYWDGRTGPLYLLFLPLVLLYGLFGYRRNETARPAALDPLLIYALAQFGFWTLGVVWSRALWQSRLLLPGLVGLAPVAGWVWASLSDFDLPGFSLKRFVNVTIALTLALTVVDGGLLTLQINPWPYLLGLESRPEYLTRRLGAYYAAMQRINEELPAEAVILFLWEPRSYYCQRDCRPDSILDAFPHTVYQHGTADAIVQRWQQAGITHVLIHRLGLNFMLRENPDIINTELLQSLEQDHLKQVFDVAGIYQVYALEPAP
jgi:4-amino-4-deoxy-L-arabinose transferase-like glycosyltransferase